MSPLRLAVIAWLALLTVSLLGCSTLERALHCDLTIVAGTPDVSVTEGDAIPPAAALIVAPAEFDKDLSSLALEDGQPRLTLRVTGDAVARLARYTETHVGATMIIGINGEVVSNPVINEAIPGGELVIALATDDVAAFQERFGDCVQ